MSAEMEAVLQKIRMRQKLTEAEKLMARHGLVAHARSNVATPEQKPKGDRIDRAAMWAKAMKRQD